MGFILARLGPTAQEKAVTPKIVFLDFEASGLFGETWPIEVGYAASCGDEDDFLLSRQPDWSLEQWDTRSQQIHGISLADLEENGVDPATALARLRRVKDAVVVSDAPDFENFWLGKIAEAAGMEAPFKVVDWESVLPSDQTREERDTLLARARAGEQHRHRAAADARIMRAVWRASWAKAHEAWAE
jgi:hypothetical protein